MVLFEPMVVQFKLYNFCFLAMFKPKRFYSKFPYNCRRYCRPFRPKRRTDNRQSTTVNRQPSTDNWNIAINAEWWMQANNVHKLLILGLCSILFHSIKLKSLIHGKMHKKDNFNTYNTHTQTQTQRHTRHTHNLYADIHIQSVLKLINKTIG